MEWDWGPQTLQKDSFLVWGIPRDNPMNQMDPFPSGFSGDEEIAQMCQTCNL